MHMKNDETNFILTCFLIFFFYVLCEEEEGEKRGERQNIMKKIYLSLFLTVKGGSKLRRSNGWHIK